MIRCLGIETSCDETSVAIVSNCNQIRDRIIFHHIFSQDHVAYGGVVPELASRAHIEKLPYMIQKAMHFQFDIVAATTHPGLIGGLLVGSSLAKTIAHLQNKPFFEVNHLTAHALTPRLSDDVAYPYLLLLVSGGHCQIVEVESVVRQKILDQTRDDSVGEAFDKVAQMLDLPYPGGPHIEKLAQKGDASRFFLPKPMYKEAGLSFSGLKTAVRLLIQNQCKSDQDRCDIASCFQKTACDVLLRAFEKHIGAFKRCVVAGGVAANSYLRAELKALCEKKGKDFFVPPSSLCTDNAAMIAWTGLEMHKNEGGYILP
jgi:N6-L-threonylcarbamoyladenine synthase